MADFSQFKGKSDQELQSLGLSNSTIMRIRAQNGEPAQVTPVQAPPEPTFETQPMVNEPIEPPQAPTMEPATQPLAPAPVKPVQDKKEAELEAKRQKFEADYQKQTEDLEVKRAQEKIEQQKKRDEEKRKLYREKGLTDQDVQEFETAIPAPPEEAMPDMSPEQYQRQTQQMLDQFVVKKSANSEIEKRILEIERKANELASRKIDPNAFWNSRTEEQKTSAAWAIALGSLNKNGVNVGMQLIKGAIDNDIAAQAKNIENEWKALNMKGDALTLRSKFNTEATPNVRLLEHQANLLSASIEQGKRLAARPNANQESLLKMTEQLTAMRDATEQQIVDVIGASAGKLEFPEDLIDEKTPAWKLSPNQRERHVAGFGVANSKENQRKFLEFKNEADKAISSLEDIIALGLKGSKLSYQDQKVMEANITKLVGQLRLPFTGPGVLTDEEYARVLNAVGNQLKIVGVPSVELAKQSSILKSLKKDVQIQAANTFPNLKFKSSYKSATPVED